MIVGLLLVSLAPELLSLCGFGTNNLATIGSCSRELVYSSFVQSSFLSSSVVLLGLESLRIFSTKLNLRSIPKRPLEWLQAESKLLLIGLLVFVLFSIIKTTIHFFDSNSSLEATFYNPWDLVQVFTIVYLAFHFLILHERFSTRLHPLARTLPVGKHKDEVALKDVHFFEKTDKEYSVTTSTGTQEIDYTLQALERMLPKKYFVRINRSAIVNLNEIDSYNYWEHEKYILKLKSGKEFIVTRKRLVGLKPKIKKPA